VDHRGRGGLAPVHVVPVEGDVEVAEGHIAAAELAHERVEAGRKQRPARVNADQGEGFAAWVLLDYLVSNPHQRAAQVVSIEDDLVEVFHLRAPSWSLGPG
jgi:hypothetical protein